MNSLTTTLSSQANSMVLACVSVDIDIVQELACNVTLTYNCLTARLSAIYDAATMSGENITLPSHIANFSTEARNISHSYSATGAYSMVISLICDGMALDVQQIITVINGKTSTFGPNYTFWCVGDSWYENECEFG